MVGRKERKENRLPFVIDAFGVKSRLSPQSRHLDRSQIFIESRDGYDVHCFRK